MQYLTSIPAFAWLLISAIFYAMGEYASKIWGMKPDIPLVIFVAIVSTISAITWLPALLHKNQLSVMGTIWLIMATAATLSIGVLVFGEEMTFTKTVGVALAVVSMILINL